MSNPLANTCGLPNRKRRQTRLPYGGSRRASLSLLGTWLLAAWLSRLVLQCRYSCRLKELNAKRPIKSQLKN
jgi:hypothetical protein